MVTNASFLNDVKRHRMTVLVDDGLHRHIRFSEPGTYCQAFEIITWRGRLCYAGDMGCYVFERLPDMFEFFRRPQGVGPNPHYWSEKVIASDRHDGIDEFDRARFDEYLRDGCAEYADEHELTPDERTSLWEAVEDEILSGYDQEHEFRDNAANFKWPDRFDTEARPLTPISFEDQWEHGFRRFTGRFVWCCYALAWAISRYDAKVYSDRMIAGMGAAAQLEAA